MNHQSSSVRRQRKQVGRPVTLHNECCSVRNNRASVCLANFVRGAIQQLFDVSDRMAMCDKFDAKGEVCYVRLPYFENRI